MEAANIELILDWLSKTHHVDNPYYTCHDESGFAVFGFVYKDIDVSIDNDGDVKITPAKPKKTAHISDYEQITAILLTVKSHME